MSNYGENEIFDGDHDSVSFKELEAEEKKLRDKKQRFSLLKKEAHDLDILLPCYLLWRILETLEIIKKDMGGIEKELDEIEDRLGSIEANTDR